MGFKQRRAKTLPEDKSQTPVSITVPQKTYQLLKAKADDMGMPVSRLICYAIDNEFAAGEDAFKYDAEMPTTVFIEKAYVAEAGKIFRFIKKFGSMSLDQIALARRDIGIDSKAEAMLGARELISVKNLVRYVYPAWIRYFKFNKDYRVIAPMQSQEDKNSKRLAELQKEMDRLKGVTNGEYIRQEAPTGPLGQAYSAAKDTDEEITD